MKTLSEIESAAKDLSLARETLSEHVTGLNESIAALSRRFLPAIKRAVNKCAEHHATLEAALAESPTLFEKPRSRVFHGIKLGYAKGKGSINIEDEENTVALINKHFKDLFDVLVESTQTPRKQALAENLTAADLKKVGCTIKETGDFHFIKYSDTEVDKLVNALLKDATEEATESQAA